MSRPRKSRGGYQLAVLLFDENGKGIDILLKHQLQGFLDQVALVVEGVSNGVQVGLRPAHDRTANTREDILQTLGCVDAAERPRRITGNADWFADERAFAVRARG